MSEMVKYRMCPRCNSQRAAVVQYGDAEGRKTRRNLECSKCGYDAHREYLLSLAEIGAGG